MFIKNDNLKQYLKHATVGTDCIYKAVGRWLFKLYLQSRAWGSDGKLLEVGSFALEVVGRNRVYFQTTVAPNEGCNFLRQIDLHWLTQNLLALLFVELLDISNFKGFLARLGLYFESINFRPVI